VVRLLKDAGMKRWIARSLFAAALAMCGICAPTWVGAQPQDGYTRSCGNQTGCRPAGSWRAAPRNETVAPYFADILMTVVGVYGHTTLEMLSSGPFMLVKWPDGCCPKSRRWRPGDSRQRHGDDKHVNFLWPAL
jgi:hypothetical protein